MVFCKDCKWYGENKAKMTYADMAYIKRGRECQSPENVKYPADYFGRSETPVYKKTPEERNMKNKCRAYAPVMWC